MVDAIYMLALAFGIVCFARMLLQVGRLHIDHPLAQFCMKTTQWLIKPLRWIVPPLGRFDMASVVAAVLVIYLAYILVAVWRFQGFSELGNAKFLAGAVFASLLDALKAFSYALLLGLLIQSVLSWQQRPTHLLTVLQNIYRPLTKPFAWMRYRQFDFSAAVLALILWWWLVSVLPYLQQNLNNWSLQ